MLGFLMLLVALVCLVVAFADVVRGMKSRKKTRNRRVAVGALEGVLAMVALPASGTVVGALFCAAVFATHKFVK